MSFIHFDRPLHSQVADARLADRRTERPHSGHFQNRRTSQLSLSPGPLMALLLKELRLLCSPTAKV